MSNIKTTSVQLGDNVTATQNFTIRTNNDGTLTLARGNVGATTQDLLTFDATGSVDFPASRGTVWLAGTNGRGSVSTSYRRWSTIIESGGADMQVNQSATLGDNVTILRSGLYVMSVTDVYSGTATSGISLNSTGPTTNITGLPQNQRLVNFFCSTVNGGQTGCAAKRLNAGDVLRVHSDTYSEAVNPQIGCFIVQRVG
jgi:hypothetical protein